MGTRAYTAKNFESLLGIKGFSDELLKTHFKLYEGYVKNTNALLDLLASANTADDQKNPSFAEARRRLGWEFDGMRLHEYYFGNLSKNPKSLQKDGALSKKISENFGSLEKWRQEFTGVGGMRGIGWVILYYDKIERRLLNIWINEHDTGHLAGAQPILVLDVFEHAYMKDYGTDRDKYLAAFWDAVEWAEAERRFQDTGSAGKTA